MKVKRIAIAGAGITGLITAWHLQKKGHEVTLFERRGKPGGAVKTVLTNGWLGEYGPNTIQLKNHRLLDLFMELGLDKRIVEANPDATSRYIVKNGTLTALPGSIGSAFFTPLFSWKGKVALLKEPFVSKGSDPDETLASFAERRLGREVLEYAINPFVAGIYAGVPDQLAIRQAFPKLYNLEQSFGSLTSGAVMKGWKDREKEKFKTRLISFTSGLSELPDQLAARIKDIRYGNDVSRIQKNRNSWELISDGVKSSAFDNVILNIPLYRIDEQMINGGGRVLDVLKFAVYPPLSVILTGYERSQVDHPLDGFGFLVPEKENRKILGSLFSSTLFPGRAPEGHVLITTFAGGARQPELASLDSEELKKIVAREHKELLGVSGNPRFFDHIYWPNSIPQYTTHYEKVLSAIRKVEELNQGVYLAGNFRGGISLPDCIENGLALAEKLDAE